MEVKRNIFNFINKYKKSGILVLSIILLFFLVTYRYQLLFFNNQDIPSIETQDEAQNFLNRFLIYVNTPDKIVLGQENGSSDENNEKTTVENKDKEENGLNNQDNNPTDLSLLNLNQNEADKKNISFSHFYKSINKIGENVITEEELKDYITLLNKSIGTKITSYQAMSELETEKYLDRIKKIGTFSQEIKNMRFYWFNTEREGLYKRFPFVLWITPSGKVFFNRNWVNQTIKLSQLMESYWQALKEGKKDVIKSFLAYRQNKINEEAWLEKKVDYLIEYYQQYFSENPENWQNRATAVAVMGDHIQYAHKLLKNVQETWQSVETNEEFYRFLEISLDNNQIILNDTVPQAIENEQFSVFKGDTRVISLAQPIDGSKIIEKFGWWADGLKVAKIEDKDGNTNLQKITIEYNDITLEIKGTFNPQTNYLVGNVVAITITGREYSSKFDIKNGSSLKSLWEKYPFIDEQYYSIQNLEGRQLKFVLKDGAVEKIEYRWHNE